MGITLRVLLQANTLTLYQSTTHIILIFSPTKIYFREVKINQELVQNQQTFQAAIPTSLLLLKPVAILPIITYNLIQLYISGNVPPNPPVGELPAHNHNVTVSTSGDHAHTFTFVKEYDAGGTEPGSASWRSNQGTKTTEQAGTHTHTVTIRNTGSNYPHNNLQPYISVYCWRRTAQQPVGELPAHGHNATANSTGDHTHTVVGRDGGATKYTDNASYYKRTDTSSTYNTGSSGSHTHSVTVDKSGEGKSHNTMQPYLSCYMWRRTV